MRDKGFSETKIAAVIAKGGDPDPDCPNDLESMRFWAFVAKKENTLEATRMKVKVQSQVNPAHALQALTASSSSFTSAVPDVAAFMSSQPALPAPGTPSAASAAPAGWQLKLELAKLHSAWRLVWERCTSRLYGGHLSGDQVKYNRYHGCCRRDSCADDRAYARLVKHKLALQSVIQYMQIPMLDDDDEVQLFDWPMILPHVLVMASVELLLALVLLLLADTKANEILQSGYGPILGHGSEQYWDTLCSQFGIDRPPCGSPAIGVQIFGDEAEIYKEGSYMCIHWMSENTPFHTDSKKSRFLICLLPVKAYAFEGKVNVTVQHALLHIVHSLNDWQRHGVQGLGCRFCSLKGDWKWLEQCLNLVRKPTTDQICFLCMATKSLAVPFTDLSVNAEWKHQVAPAPWAVQPAICSLEGFNMSLVSMDIMHCWHLGWGRDLASSVLVVLLRSHAFDGATVP
eukprot:Skav232995  [mRNA]  locus=scaffold387:175239:177630:- [translate_table: standard]